MRFLKKLSRKVILIGGIVVLLLVFLFQKEKASVSPGAHIPAPSGKFDMETLDPRLLDLSDQYQPVQAEIDKNIVGSLSSAYINSADSGIKFRTKGINGREYSLVSTLQGTKMVAPVISTGNTISYNGIFPRVNLAYHLFDGYVKEDIILEDKYSPRTFTYKLEYGDNIFLDASEGGYIKIKDKNTNEDIFMLRTPQGFDKKSQRIDYGYQLNGNMLTLYPNRSWQYEQAVFPVTIVSSLSIIDWDEAAVSVGTHCPENDCGSDDGSIGDIEPAGYNWAKDTRTKAVIVKIPKLTKEERAEFISKTREAPSADTAPDDQKLSDLSPKEKERIFSVVGIARYGIDYTKLATVQELAMIRDLNKDKFSPILDASHDKSVIIKKNNPLVSVIPKDKVLAYHHPTFTDKIGAKLIQPVKAAGTVTKTIGTTGRDYTTIGGGTTCTAGVTWEACEDGDLVSAQEIHVGEMYKDSTFTITTGQQAIDGSTTNSSYYMHLTAAASDRHNGTAGTGVVIDFNGGAGNLAAFDPNTVVDWLEIKNIRGSNGNSLVGSTADGVLFQNLILHDFNDASFSQRAFRTQASGTTFRNTIIYDGGAQGLRGNTGFALTVQNLTIYGIGTGINEDGGTFTVTNTISMNNTGDDFNIDNGSLTNVLCEDNLSDCNAGTLTTCTNCLYNKSASTQFVSTTAGKENFHLTTKSDAIGRGSDLSVNFTDDIDNDSRPQGASWDIGADEQATQTVDYLKFDEGTGTTANDSTSYANNGTLAGSTKPSWQTEDMCISGKCLNFPGTTASVTVANTIAGVQSVSFWAKSATSSAALVTLNNGAYVMASNSTIAATGFTSPIYYINGLQTTSPTLTANQWTYVTVTSTVEISSSAINIGSASNNFLQGFMDDFKLYNYALSNDQVKLDYNIGLSRQSTAKGAGTVLGGVNPDIVGPISSGLVGYWRMNEATWSGTLAEVVDSSGNSNHGQAQGATGGKAYPAAGKFGNGGYFDGVDDRVALANAIDFSSKPSWTVSGWFKRTGTSTSIQTLVDYDYNNNSFGLALNGGSLTWETGSGDWGRVYGPTLPTSWSYVTAIFSGTSGNWSVNWYLNGVLQSTTSSTLAFNTPQIRYFGGPGVEGGAVINIDDLRVYNRALSPSEVSQLYNWAPGPVGYWKMEEGSGNPVDSSGNGLSSTWNGTSNHLVNGKYGKAGKFGGSGPNDYISVTDNNVLDSKYMTQEAWIYPQAFTDGASIYNRRTSGNSGGVTMEFTATGGLLRCWHQISASWQNVETITALTLNKWTHVSCTYDGTTIRVYLNGVLNNSNNVSGTIDSPTTPLVQIGLNNTQASYFTGYIDNLQIYNYPRLPKQIIEDMNASHPAVGSPVGSAIGYWKLNEGYGSTTHDSSPNGNNGTFGAFNSGNNPTWNNNGKFGNAVYFASDQDNYINLGDPSSGIFDFGTADFSLSFWFKTSQVTTAGKYPEMIRKMNASNVGYEIFFGDSSYPGDVFFKINDGTYNQDATFNGTLNDNVWHHAVGVKTVDVLTLYIDGIKKNTAAHTVTGTLSNASDLMLGTYDAYNWSEYNGLIDEVKLYNYALTSDEVKTEYNHGSSIVLGSFSDTSGLTGGSVASNSASAAYCIPGDTATCSPPKAEWKFEEGRDNTCSGGTNDVCDTTGDGNDGAWNGTLGNQWTTGKIGKAGSFNGTDNFVNAGNNASLKDQEPFTITAWIKPTGNAEGYIVAKRDGSTTGYWAFVFSTGFYTNTLEFFKDTDGTTLDVAASNNVLTLDAWNFVTVTWDGSLTATNVHFYVNGKETTYQTQNNGTGNKLSDASHNTLLGSRGGTQAYYTGLLDDVRFYNYIRTPAQILWDYNRGAPVGYWKLNECQGTTINDSTGNGSTGTWSGPNAPHTGVGTCTTVDTATAWYNGKNGRFNASLDFDGNDDIVTVNNSSKLNDLGPYSLSLWFKADTGASGHLLSKRDAGCTGPWRIDATTGTITWFKTGTAGAGDVDFNVANAYADNVWNHLVITWDGTIYSSGAKLYVNGVQLVKTAESDAGSPLLSDAACKIYIGRRYDGTSQFEGQIDEVKIYNYVLTPAQVKMEYNQGSAVMFAPLTGTP